MDRVTDDQPSTAEGKLLRARRDMLGLTAQQASEGTAIGRSGWGDIERGRTRAAKGKPPEEWHAPASDVAIMAIRLGVRPDELRQAGRADAAEIVERETAKPSPAQVVVPAVDADSADFDRLFRALTEGRPDTETLWYLAHALDGEGRLRSFKDRVDLIVGYLAAAADPARTGQDGLKAV